MRINLSKKELRLLCISLDETIICNAGCICESLKSGYKYNKNCKDCSLKRLIDKLHDYLEVSDKEVLDNE